MVNTIWEKASWPCLTIHRDIVQDLHSKGKVLNSVAWKVVGIAIQCLSVSNLLMLMVRTCDATYWNATSISINISSYIW